MSAWWDLDPARTLPPETFDPSDYPTRVLDTQVLARRRPDGPWLVGVPLTLRDWAASGEPLTTADIDLHLSMLFPPVRPQGYLELRYLDQQPAGEWAAVLALIAALFRSGESVRQVLEACTPVAGRWRQATECGLADDALRQVAGDVLELARPGLPGLRLDPAALDLVTGVLDRRLRAGISPGMDALRRPDTVLSPDRELR
jgi:glutamate--cysteine ligase